MPDELSLFGDERSVSPPVEPPKVPLANDWQVDLLRKSLDARGLSTMEERQQAIESAVGRPVESLRALTADEALQTLTRLGQHPATRPSSRSAWDDRDGDTWIDRL